MNICNRYFLKVWIDRRYPYRYMYRGCTWQLKNVKIIYMFYRLVFDRGEYLIRVSQNYGLWQLFSVKYRMRENWLLSLLSLMYGTLYKYIKFCSIFKNHVTFVFGNFNIDSITSCFVLFFIYPRSPKREGGILFYLCPSVRPRYFSAHFSQ